MSQSARSPFPLALAMIIVALCAAFSAAAEPPQSSAHPARVQVLIAYDTLRGSTQQMAQGVAEGVAQVTGAEAVLKPISEISKQDLEAAQGIVLGCPTYFANIPGRMKLVLDDWNWKLKVDFTDKVGGAFATGGGQTGGKEHVVNSLLLFMLSNRMIVVGPLYEDAEDDDRWGEPGSSAMTGPLDPGVGTGELEAARRLGQRVARVALRVKD